MVSTLAAQTANQTTAKVVRLKGSARYSTGGDVWQQLKVGDIVKPGTAIQTAADSRVDIVLGEGSPITTRPTPSDMVSYAPTAEQNMVRIWDNTLLGIDKLTETETGADVVTGVDSSCLMNIQGMLSRRGSKVRAVHIAEILAAQGEGRT